MVALDNAWGIELETGELLKCGGVAQGRDVAKVAEVAKLTANEQAAVDLVPG